jgi:putative ABC transport system permease protein
MLLRMIVLQAVLVGIIGYGLGVGLASAFGFVTRNSELSFRMPWWLLGFSAAAVTVICVMSSCLSMLKVFRLEPAVVFKG